MASTLSKLVNVIVIILFAAISFIALGIFLLLAGWNNWFPFRPESQLDNTVLSFAENGEVSTIVFYESDYPVPGVRTVWGSAKVSFNSSPAFQVLSQVSIEDVKKLGFTKADLKGDTNSLYYRRLESQFHFVDGKLKSCRIDCDNFENVRLQLSEGCKIFALPIGEYEFNRLLADARRRNRARE